MIKKRGELQSQIAQKYKMFNRKSVQLNDMGLSYS